MIGVKHIRELTTDSYLPTDQNYLLVQSKFEGYIKRLLFIALRKNGLQYKLSQELISSAPYNLTLTKQLELAFKELTGISYSERKKSDKKLQILEGCMLGYVRPIRNKIAHGADHNLNIRLLDLCMKITQEYVRTIDSHLKLIAGCSAFDKPKDWGAQRVEKNDGLPKRLKDKFGFKDIKKFSVEKIEKDLVKGGIKLS
jgi:hypothetical protein